MRLLRPYFRIAPTRLFTRPNPTKHVYRFKTFRQKRFLQTSPITMAPSSVLIVGAQRGLGTALTKRYSELIGSSGKVFATAEKPVSPGESARSHIPTVYRPLLTTPQNTLPSSART